MKSTDGTTTFPFDDINGYFSFEYVPCMNYSMVINKCPSIINCLIVNKEANDWQHVRVTLEGEMLSAKQAFVDLIPAHSEFDLKDTLSLVADGNALINLTEGINSHFTLAISVGDKEVLRHDFPIYLMVYDQWTGASIRPELLASFVTPNQPLLSRVAANAAKYLEKWTGSGSLNEYQSHDPNRVRKQVAAIFEALREESLVYATPPASFEKHGQRLRLADEVLTGKLGTCIDLSLLVASCLESIGINPMLIMTPGHCFVGAWLVNTSYGYPVGDDASFLAKSAADGVNELVVFETTYLTSSGNVTFEDAVKEAMKTVNVCAANPDHIFQFVDVNRARVCGIRPLPVRVAKDGRWVIENEGVEHENATLEVKQYDRYDLTALLDNDNTPSKIQIWERKLLDFTLRNSLLNMNPGRKILQLISFSIDKLEDYMQEGKTFRVLPFPFDANSAQDPREMCESSIYNDNEEFVRKAIGEGRLYSFKTEGELKSSLKDIYRASRTALEENGANNLFLVIGLLQWLPEQRSEIPCYAPILLLPIEIVRGGGASGYIIRTRDEDIMLNITLTELLKQFYNIDLSVLNTLPTDQSGVDVKMIFSIIRDRIKDKKGWNVLDESVIGLFSFNKFVMWNDIHSNTDKLRENPIISSFIEGKLKLTEEIDDIDAREIDKNTPPADFTIPVDVDSSQLEAVIAAGEGKSFILHGPPGTGKSQTITNIIANALSQGKRVLFVAEKMAALSVVQSRLEKIGLAPFCLELHSNKVSKQHFLRQMEAALNVTHQHPSVDYQKRSDELYAERQKLMGYIEALHAKQPGGLSLFDCISAYLALDGNLMDVSEVDTDNLSEETLAKLDESLKGVDTLLKICGNPAQSGLRELDITDGSAKAEDAFGEDLKACLNALAEWKQCLAKQGNKTAQMKVRLDEDCLIAMRAATKLLRQYQETKQELTQRYDSAVLDFNVDNIESQWNEIQQKWFLARHFAEKSYLNTWQRYKVSSAADVENIIHGLHQLRQNEKQLATVDFADSQSFMKSDCDGWKALIAAGEQWFFAIDELQRSVKIAPEILQDPEALEPLLRQWQAHKSEYRDWFLWSQKCRELSQMGCACVIHYIVEGQHSGAEAAKALRKSLYEKKARQIIHADDHLRFFNEMLFADVIEKYRKLTAQFQELSKQELFCKLAAKVPATRTDFAESSEPGFLKRNIKSGGRGTSIRKIIDQIPTLLPRLCPCMLMSPISVAQYLDMKNEKFDLIIFDEASQIPTSEAVGAIARGKALVVVGDPKQMPPTSFFTTQQVDEEEADIDDMESILDDCITLSMPSKYLTWHYRSKHESLITFSNSQYYNGRLLTFPSVDDQVSKITLHHIEGVYDKGRTRSNKDEARAVVEEVVRRLSDAEMSKKSIGIVAFSQVQQNLIEDLLLEELEKHPQLEKMAYERNEPIFVKNLENVQGDERDVILFSVGYGPDENGRVSMNFGPLNNKGGERRLNVAVSRARYEMLVFSTLKPEQIDLRRTQALGVEGLKRFLEFAEKGIIPATMANSQATPKNELANDIANELTQRGYAVQTKVGRSQFKIDVAVQDPDNPKNYLLGILCDGHNYYSTKTVRDREVVQPSVLRMLHWNIMHVWSIDWFEHREKVIADILAKIADIKANAEMPQLEQAAETQDWGTAPSTCDDSAFASDAITPSPASPCEEYVSAVITAPCQITDVDEFVYRAREIVPGQLEELIRVEAPITNGLLYKRIVKTWGLARVSPKIQSVVDGALGRIAVFRTSNDDNGFVYWNAQDEAERFDAFRHNSDRDIQDIPYIEIENAMKFVIDTQIAINQEELKRLTGQQLGYNRMGTNINAATQHTLDSLTQQGYVVVNEGKVAKA